MAAFRFGVGGNSLDAARVIDAIVAESGVQLPLNARPGRGRAGDLAA